MIEREPHDLGSGTRGADFKAIRAKDRRLFTAIRAEPQNLTAIRRAARVVIRERNKGESFHRNEWRRNYCRVLLHRRIKRTGVTYYTADIQDSYRWDWGIYPKCEERIDDWDHDATEIITVPRA